ncbi:MAG: peptidoglycan DD-metalloendopeptidase family protein [Clostridiales bacterium]|nr:peptidoglycan DD-metalloendopeptidase family protein [Clostridiales bacterium]
MKKHIKYIAALAVMASLAVTSLPHIEAEAKTLTELQNERDQLSKQTKEAQQKLKEAQQKQANVEAEITAMDDVINAAQKELDSAQADLDDVTARLEASQKALEEANIKREQQFVTFSGRMRFFYENSQLSYLDILLQSEGFSDMLRRLQYIDDIMSYDQNLLTELTATQNEIKTRTEEIKVEKEQSEYLLGVAQEKMDSLDAIVAEKRRLVESYAQDEAKYNQLISSNEKASQEAQAMINKILAEQTPSTTSYVYTGGQLNWPVPSRSASSSSLSSGYVSRNRPIGRGSEFHTGYDIPASYGSAVVAAEAGTVIYAGWMSGYGNTIMINHGNGLVTLYGHNSSLTVSKGDTVSRGQQVAKIGSTGNSTGNHCHFEVRVNGSHTNPEPYLGVPNIGY